MDTNLIENEKINLKYNIGIEIGGTNIKVAIANSNLKMNQIIDDIISNNILIKEFKTNENPELKIKEICEWILSNKFEYFKVGISMFGPLNLNKNSEDFGKVLNTPKLGWKGFNLINSISNNLKINKENIFLELDVNCAAFLELKLGMHNVDSLAYITIGTGVGVGLIQNAKVIHGLQHPEGGHIRVNKTFKDDFKGVCSIHGDCLEGLISNIALKERKHLKTVDECSEISDEDDVWNTLANYIAQLCLNLLYLNSLQKIIIGGGIINREILLKLIRLHFIELNNNYIDNPLLKEDKINNYIMRTNFKNNSGILSAFSLILE